MVGEEIERTPAWPRVLSHQNPVLALIEECPGFLSPPRRSEVLQPILHDLDYLGHLTEGQHNLSRQPLVAPDGCVIAEQDALGCESRRDSGDDVRSCGLEPCREQLRDDPGSVLVDDEGRQTVAFSVHDAPCTCLDSVAATRGCPDARGPPLCIDGFVGPREEPEPDLGARGVERLAEELAFAIGDGDDARFLLGLLGDVAAIDPGVALFPALRASGCDFDRQRSGLSFAASLRYICFSEL